MCISISSGTDTGVRKTMTHHLTYLPSRVAFMILLCKSICYVHKQHSWSMAWMLCNLNLNKKNPCHFQSFHAYHQRYKPYFITRADAV